MSSDNSTFNFSVISVVSDGTRNLTKWEDRHTIAGPTHGRTDLEIGWTSALLLVIILVTLLGNLAVIFAVYSSRRLRDEAANLFIINLSVADISNGSIVMCTALFAIALDVHHINDVWCNIVCAANYIFIIVSMLTLAFISVERYIAIVHTFRHNELVTRLRIRVAVGYTWLQGLAFALPPVILKWVHYDYWESICAIDWQYEKRQAVYYVIVAFVVCFMIPGCAMVFCYTMIIRQARKSQQIMPGNRVSAQDQDNPAMVQMRKARKSASKTIRSLLVVVALFFVCMTPFCITKLLKVIFSDAARVPSYANLTASYFQYLASMVNPFVYAIFRTEFRNAYRLAWYRLLSEICNIERPTIHSGTGSANH